MKKILLCLLLLFIPVICIKANSISNINMDIYIDNNGDAIITETWNAYVNEGTEGYHPYFNIGTSTIVMLEASMDGKEYDVSNYWNINESISNKAYKAGIYRTGNEIDLCFGLSSYGNHTYTMKYKITNFVLSASDADIVYWTLFPYDFNATPNKVYIKMYSDFDYADTLDVWGYGNYGGTAYVYDGYIEMESPQEFDSSEYMTILVKFPKSTFTTNNTTTNDFNYYYNMAEEGTTKYIETNTTNTKSKTSFFSIIGSIMLMILSFIFELIPFVIIALIIGRKTKNNKYTFGATGNKVREDVPMFRDIPCNKDLFRAYFVSVQYKLNNKKKDLLGAVLLKWLRKGNVKVEKYEHKTLFKTETLDNIVFINCPDTNQLESKLYNWMFEASKDGKLEANEFKKWCSNNYNKIIKWFDEVIDFERDELVKENKIKVIDQNKKFFNTINYEVDPSMMTEAEQLAGLKKFLKEFSVIEIREPIEVKIWDEYLIFAQIFGMADEVANQFKKLYPDIVEKMKSMDFNYNDIIFINNISATGMSSATTAQSRAQSYSSGGGGFSSGGGGGGSFGGGGGGGGFR